MAGATRREQEAYARLAVEEANHSAKTQSNVRLKRLMDTNVLGVVTFTDKGVIEANDVVGDVLGYPLGELHRRALQGGLADGDETRRRIDELAQSGELLVPAPIAISAGVTRSPEDGEDAETLFATADARLYEAKRASAA